MRRPVTIIFTSKIVLLMSLGLGAFAHADEQECGHGLDDGIPWELNTSLDHESARAKFRPPRYYAYRAVPSLFPPDLYEPPRRARLGKEGLLDNFFIDRMPYFSAAQVILDEATIARSPESAALIGRLTEGQVLPELVVSTHMLPKMQDRVAEWIDRQPRLAGVPKVALVTSTPAFNVTSPAFEKKMDAFFISERGESHILRAREIWLIGGFEDACLSNTILDLLIWTGKAGVSEITVHVLVDATYTQRKMTYGGLLRDRSMSKAKALAWLKDLNPSLWPVAGTFDRPHDGHPRIEVQLIDRDIALGHSHPRTTARVKLIVE